ncbi:MAG TPA: hypothetical protein VK066_17250 [Chloroflexota bacterium]|nr:hypothetical protein [Chloroflexota bacterium]
MAALIDALDAWVDRGVAPAPSKSDAPGYEPALALPEVACPLGVYYAGPPQFPGPPGTQRTAFAAFDGASPEPVDSVLRQLVDMNGNGVADTRETVEAAWRRLGLLRPDETFDGQVYAACLADAARDLVQQGLLPPDTTAWYAREAPRLLADSGAAWGKR